MRYVMRLMQEFTAKNDKEAEEFAMEQIREGMKTSCVVELSKAPDPEEAEQMSFHELLNNLNSGDMTKN